MAPAKQTFIFGPVPSRRLGLSLGVDLVSFKTCSYDCIYCQLGRTTRPTIERKQYVPLAEVQEQPMGPSRITLPFPARASRPCTLTSAN